MPTHLAAAKDDGTRITVCTPNMRFARKTEEPPGASEMCAKIRLNYLSGGNNKSREQLPYGGWRL